MAYLDNAVALPDVGQELVAEPLALAGPLDQASNIHKLHSCAHGCLGLGQVCQDIQAAVWDAHHPYIGLNGAEREVGSLGLAVFAHGVEQRGLQQFKENQIRWRMQGRNVQGGEEKGW